MAKLAIAALSIGMLAGAAAAQVVQPVPADIGPVPLDAPYAAIGNDFLKARIYLPDAEKGFYRGTRFDQMGVVGSLSYDGQEYYGPWFDHTSPQVSDFIFAPQGIVAGPDSAITGPVEEFAPIGFEEARPGGTFLKIGIGVLRKPDDKPYDHYRIYQIVDAGSRTIRRTKSGITFIQNVDDKASGYGFHYVKSLLLVPNRPEMLISHLLRNTGSKPISTNVYDHNFLKLSSGNGDIAITLPFAVNTTTPPPAELARIEGNKISYARPLTGEEKVSFLITGFGDQPSDYDVKVENTRTGAGVQVTADQPLARLNLWSIRSVMAMEPYIAIDLASGADKQWTYHYSYSARK